MKGQVPHVRSSTNFRLGCLLLAKKYFSLHQQPILQLVVGFTNVIVTFPLFRKFPVALQNNITKYHLLNTKQWAGSIYKFELDG